MSVASQLNLQHYAQALSQIEQLEKWAAKAITDLKKLKAGEVSIDQFVVTDNGYEVMPAPPKAEKAE